MNRKHIAFFSRTGSEIVALATALNRWPDLIITNKPNLEGIHDRILNEAFGSLVLIPNKPTIEEYETAIGVAGDKSVITLHGYLKVIPKEICSKYEMYNGHPGAIGLYPELKGFNPQLRASLKHPKYPKIGSVIHRVTADVDCGEIIMHKEIDNVYDEITIFPALKDVSKSLWVNFLIQIL